MTTKTTLPHQLEGWAKKAPDDAALHERTGPGTWRKITWRQYADMVRQVGRALIALGHKTGDAVGIIAKNRYELVVAQLGVMHAGGVPVPIYKTSTAEQISWILDHAEARFAIGDGQVELDKLGPLRGAMPKLERLIAFDPVSGADPAWTMSWGDFLARGPAGAAADAALDARLAAVDPEAMSFLCYTSGTTGRPKGAMLSHAALTGMSDMVLARFGHQRDRIISYLPLSHIAEQIFSVLLPLAEGAEVFFCDDLAKLRELLPEVRPTLFLGVPRVWEKFHAALAARLAEATGAKAKLAKWALATELTAFQRHLAGTGHVSKLRRALARKLVLSKIHARLGLDAVRFATTGSAPTPRATLEFFASLGLPLHEGYGMTETTGLLTTSIPGRPVVGTVGRALDAIELRIADDGEILARGPTMSRGYYKDEAQTQGLWEGGWLHTGDIGQLDGAGELRITDRKKELLKTSGGKYISPQAIEARLKAIRGVGQAVVIGDGKNYVTALLVLDPEAAPALAAELGLDGQDLAALAREPKVRAHLQARVDAEVNAGQAKYESIKRIALLPGELSVAGGELTPTLKLKRKVVATKYAAEIDALYTGDKEA